VNPTRSFLLLQGVCSPFFAHLGDRLQDGGHRIAKVNFNGGDIAYGRARPSWSFRGRLERLPAFLQERNRTLGVTDQILFGDCRPVHRTAIAWAKEQGIRTHVFEEGYFRPFWVTLERGGVNARSALPRDPRWFQSIGARLPDYGDGEPFPSPLRVRAWHDVMYHLASAVNSIAFPGYRTHAPVTAPIEYLGYARRFTLLARIERREQERVAQLAGGSVPFFLLPLQLNGDAQIREHSRFGDMREVIEVVMQSFARHAPEDARLVIKNHPLDMGLVDYARIIRRLERRFGLEGRTDYLEAGDLMMLLRRARGLITVNSTVGPAALSAGVATLALSDPIYNLPGLTFQGSLDEFWRDPTPPDAALFRCFRNTVIHATQVNGGLYTRRGIELTVRNAARALLAERSPLEELLNGG
jgi:capsular polysaccharide export protein